MSASSWLVRRLDEVFAFQGGAQPPASTFTDVPGPGTVRLVQIRDYYTDAHITYVPDSPRLNHCSEQDVMIARYGASVGRICRGIAGAYNVALVRTIPKDGTSRDFLFYLLQSDYFQNPLLGQSARSAQAGFSRDSIGHILLPNPPLAEQRAIAEVLGALDDKIAANRQVLSGTDGLVRARYDQVMASAAKTRELRDVATNPRQTVAPEKADPGELYVGLEHIPRRQMWLGAVGKAAEVTSAKSAFQESDVLFGKLRPYFHKVVAAPGAGICSTDVLVVRAVEREMSGLVLAACSSDAAIAAATSAADGTRMPRAKWKDIAQLSVPAPDSSEARSLSAEVNAFAHQALALRVENEKLAATRDGLLPLLMSGKLRVKDAERQVGEVV